MRWRSSSWALVAIVLCCMLGAAQQPSMIGLDGGAAVSNPGGMYAGNSGVVYTAVAFDVDTGARFAGAWGDPALGANWAAIPADHNAGNFYHDGDATNIALRVSFENVNLTDLNFLLAGNGGCGILGVRDVASPGFGLEPHAADVAIYDMTQQGAGWPPAAGDPTDATRHYLFQSWQRDAGYIGSTGEGPDQGWNSNPTGGPSGTDESYDTFDVVLEFAPQADGTVRMYVFERIHNTWDIWSNGVMKWNPHDWHWNGVNRYYNVLPKANGGDYMTDVYVFAAAGNGPFATTIGGHTITWSEIWVKGTVANRPVIAWVDGAWTGPNDDGGHTWGYDGFSVIQSAVDAVEVAGTVNVAAGAYTEQVVVDAALNLIGSGPSTVIEAPDKLTQYFMSGSNKNYPIIYVHDTDNAVIQDLVVDGLGKGNTNSRFVGIGFYNAGGAVDNVEIRNVENTPFSGAQHGVGIYAYNADGTPRALIITGCSVHDFQKNAMALLGAGLTVDVSGNNVVVGEGRTAAIAQNGIQVGSGAGGRIADNAVSGVWYTGTYWGSTGILILDAAPGIQILRNTVTDCQMGINSDTDQTLVEGNTVIGSDWAIILYGNDSLAAGNDIVGSAYGLYADGNGAEFLGNVVRGADWSALLYGAGAELHYNSISGSTSGFYSDLSADASLNWWGDATGPSFDQDMDGSTEYDGLGEAVYGSVVFSPWLALDPDGDSSAPGVQVTAPVLIVVAPVGPEPTDGYLNAAIVGANSDQLPYTDTIHVHQGSYDGSCPITQPVTLAAAPGSCGLAGITGEMSVASGNVQLGLPLLGLRIDDNVTVEDLVDATSVHINWCNLNGSVANNGTGTLDAQYNYWGTWDEGVIEDRTIGDIDWSLYLPKSACLSYQDIQTLLTAGLVGSLEGAIDQLWTLSRMGMDASTYAAYGGVAGAGAGRLPGESILTQLLPGGGGGSISESGIEGSYAVGEKIVGQAEVFDPVSGAEISDAVVTITLVDAASRIVYWGAASYDESLGEYVFEVDTSSLAPGTYELMIQTDDGETETFTVVVAAA